ncbi:outer membrane beta-barrel protein [Salibacter halophilus]|uniref:Outer membrane beta-barrel protein n=1 Tax=Salibacter halophilus TaxID=1803916 RepID=A0A6N6M5H7_9FLAO|nr:outer membrane beta-barrel protein [Salibacter halophilus]KAB1064877.1 outer membrane beta-barrel protein [Salibacter halophilus]
MALSKLKIFYTMKSFNIFFISLMLFTLSSITANAQIRLGGGFMSGVALGDFSNTYSIGFGGNVSAKYMVKENISVGLKYERMGYIAEQPDFTGINTTPPQIDPLTMNNIYLTGSYHLMPNEDINIYAGLNIGVNLIRQYIVYSGPFLAPQSQVVKNNEFTIVPKIGGDYMVSEEIGVEFSAGYAIAGDFQYIPVSLGVIYLLDEKYILDMIK